MAAGEVRGWAALQREGGYSPATGGLCSGTPCRRLLLSACFFFPQVLAETSSWMTFTSDTSCQDLTVCCFVF